MPVSINNTQVVFNDGTTQSSAANPSSYIGARGQVFNGNGTFTIPTGVTAVQVTVVGAGGGGGGYNPGCCGNPAGRAGSGNTSSVASGNQAISTISATGGQGGDVLGNVANGNGSGGDLNFTAGQGGETFGGGLNYGRGGNAVSPGGSGGTAIRWLTGLTPGANLSVTRGNGGNPTGAGTGAGLGGVIYFQW